MTTLADLPFHAADSPATPTGAQGRKRPRRHAHQWCPGCERQGVVAHCVVAGCGIFRDDPSIRRGRNNRSRGNRAELDVARLIPGARKMGSLGLPWDVEVGEYARLQVKCLARRPSSNAILDLIQGIPDTGDRLRGFVWVSAPGKGHRAEYAAYFLTAEFAAWHGADFGPGTVPLVTMPLATWVAEFVEPDTAPEPAP